MPYTGQTTRSKKDGFVQECVLQDASYAVGQGLVQDQRELEIQSQAGFVHSPPREQTTEELHRRVMDVPVE